MRFGRRLSDSFTAPGSFGRMCGLSKHALGVDTGPRWSGDLPLEPALSSPCGHHCPWSAVSRGPWRRLPLSGTCWRAEGQGETILPSYLPCFAQSSSPQEVCPGAVTSDLLVTRDLEFQVSKGSLSPHLTWPFLHL